jgi:hypothetical protein
MSTAYEAVRESDRKSGGWARARSSSPAPTAAHPLLTLQRQAGNQAVQNLLHRGIIQAKLTISNPGDPEEQEADQVADRVMRAHAGSPVSAPCSCAEGEEDCEACRQKKAIESPHNFRGPVNERNHCGDRYGCAWCNDRGQMETAVDHEHCAGNCVDRHEKTHASDESFCCERYGRCMAKAPPGQNPCRDAMDRWLDNVSDWTECNAFKVESQCLSEILTAHCKGSKDRTVTEECCGKLQTELDFVAKNIEARCPKSLPMPCPFAENGSIISGLSSFSVPQPGLSNQANDPDLSSGSGSNSLPAPSAALPLHALQQRAGNQAVQNLLHGGMIQAKLTVSSPGDPEEQEADQVADHIMRAPAGFPAASPCSCAAGGEMCEECEQKQTGVVSRKSSSADARPASHAALDHVLRSPGQPLDAAARGYFEPRFGQDFSHVRVHTGREAEESAGAINARAYTAGNHVVFGTAQYHPSSFDGQRLLAHELTHVVQQGVTPSLRIQRAVEVRPPGRGEASAFDRRQELIDRMNALSTGVSYALSGQRFAYTVTNAANATPFDRQMEGLIDRAEVVPLRLITSAGRVGSAATGFGSLLIDSLEAGYLDLDDMRASDDNSFKMNLLHLLTERFAVPNYERRIGTNMDAEFGRAHAAGLQAETQYLRDTIGDPTIRFVFEETKPGGNTLVFGYRSAEGYSIFHVFLRSQQAVSGGQVWVQTRDNRHISINDLIAERAAARAPRAPGP